MALIACLECKHEVSTASKSCPSCGAKTRVPKRPMSTITKALLAVLGVGVIAIAAVDSGKKEESRKTAERRIASMSPEQIESLKVVKKKRDSQLQAAGIGALTLKNSMKDPEAFELKSMVVKINGAACYEYRAKNSFGATFPGSAVLSPAGKLLVQERDRNLFVALWNKECVPSGGDEIADYVKRVGIL